MFEKLARRILKREMAELESLRDAHRRDRNSLDDLTTTMTSRLNEASEQLKQKEAQISELNERIDDLTKKNEIMEKYYRLDEEPSEEIQMKILKNLKIHDLERENLNLRLQQTSISTIAIGLAQNLQEQCSSRRFFMSSSGFPLL